MSHLSQSGNIPEQAVTEGDPSASPSYPEGAGSFPGPAASQGPSAIAAEITRKTAEIPTAELLSSISAPYGASESDGGHFVGVKFESQFDDDTALHNDSNEHYADRMGPHKLKPRHEAIAWMLASGAIASDIARELNMTTGRLSILVNNKLIKARVREIRDKHWGERMDKRFANIAPKAVDVAEAIITGSGEFTGAKISERWDAAKWMLEKTTGKPKQELEVDGGAGIKQLLTALGTLAQAAAEGGPPVSQVIDVTPTEAPNEIDAWVTQHVPELGSEKT